MAPLLMARLRPYFIATGGSALLKALPAGRDNERMPGWTPNVLPGPYLSLSA